VERKINRKRNKLPEKFTWNRELISAIEGWGFVKPGSCGRGVWGCIRGRVPSGLIGFPFLYVRTTCCEGAGWVKTPWPSRGKTCFQRKKGQKLWAERGSNAISKE